MVKRTEHRYVRDVLDTLFQPSFCNEIQNHTTWSPSNLSNASENQHATAIVAATQAKGTGIQGTWLILLLLYKVWECQDAGLFVWRYLKMGRYI